MPVATVLGKRIVVRRVPFTPEAEGVKETLASAAGKRLANVQQGRTSIAVTSAEVAVNPSRFTVMDEVVLDATMKYVPARLPAVTKTKYVLG